MLHSGNKGEKPHHTCCLIAQLFAVWIDGLGCALLLYYVEAVSGQQADPQEQLFLGLMGLEFPVLNNRIFFHDNFIFTEQRTLILITKVATSEILGYDEYNYRRQHLNQNYGFDMLSNIRNR